MLGNGYLSALAPLRPDTVILLKSCVAMNESAGSRALKDGVSTCINGNCALVRATRRLGVPWSVDPVLDDIEFHQWIIRPPIDPYILLQLLNGLINSSRVRIIVPRGNSPRCFCPVRVTPGSRLSVEVLCSGSSHSSRNRISPRRARKAHRRATRRAHFKRTNAPPYKARFLMEWPVA
jgi:hypothetical protein